MLPHILSVPMPVLPMLRRKGQGEEMLERMRAAGRPITPAMEKMAKWMDSVEAEANMGEVPMLKPGG